MKIKTDRSIGIELLRIILMLFIIEGHFLTHTNIREEVAFMTPKWVIIWGIQSITICAVNGFVLISGYCQKADSIKLDKVFRLWGQVFFYSLFIFGISLFLGYPSNIVDILKTVFPITCKQYWFFTVYVFLYVLAPFINICIRKLTKKGFQVLVIIMVSFTVIKPTIFPFVDQYDPTEGFGIVSFLTLYVIGAYIREYNVDIKYKKIFLLISIGVVFLSKIVLELIVQKNVMNVGTGLFYHYNTVFQVINSILLLLLFKDYKINDTNKLYKVISYFAISTFGVYLIHEHPFTRYLLWKRLINLEFLLKISVEHFILLVIVIPICIFIMCTIIDHIRRKITITILSLEKIKRLTKKITISIAEEDVNGQV